MNVTVCELPDSWTRDDEWWNRLVDHLKSESSDLLVLPEMPFYQWLTKSDKVDPALWKKAVDAHGCWIQRLYELPVENVIASRPTFENGRALNNGFIFTKTCGLIPVHDKFYLPDEAGYWEATWYERGDGMFNVATVDNINIGFLICTELWFTQRAREYLAQDIDILVCPRATPLSEVDIWVTGGRSAAIVSGAFCLSSNFQGPNTPTEDFGGTGWIIEPERGDVLGSTIKGCEFLTLDIDLNNAKKAKASYPRYVKE